MRKLIMGIMLVTSFNVDATDCTMLHDVAEQIMIARQNGAPITKVIELSKACRGSNHWSLLPTKNQSLTARSINRML